ncbi:MAG: bifunctional 4-hydroxy-2-oxoglutarate aldolase/2-dehydro-3-deoxy-phosphogluconate aldolase [Acidobacteriota bacterium]
MDRSIALQRILDGGVIAILRASNPTGLVEAAQAIAEGGVTAVEFTMTTPKALDLIGAARERLGRRALIGAGTVLNAENARAALAAGAEFIVMPVLDRGAIETAHRADVPVMPGAYTPTEILTAWEWGADLVKLFPASAGGPAYLQAILAPLPQVRLVPTGGVGTANTSEYIRAGAAAVAVGGNLVDPAAIAAGEFYRLTEVARQLIEAVRKTRAEKPQ